MLPSGTSSTVQGKYRHTCFFFPPHIPPVIHLHGLFLRGEGSAQAGPQGRLWEGLPQRTAGTRRSLLPAGRPAPPPTFPLH